MSDTPTPGSTSALLEAAPAPAAASAPAAAPAAAPPAEVKWLEGADQDTLAYVQRKGWNSPADVLTAFRGAEKFISAPVEQRVVIPGDSADEATRNAFYDKLGRPKDAAGYEFKLGEQDAVYEKGLKDLFHKNGLSGSQAKNVIEGYGALAKAENDKALEAKAAALQGDHQKLMAEWGQAAQQNLQLVRRGAELLGFKNEDIDALGSALGHSRAMKLLHSVAARSGEADFVAGDSSRPAGTGLLTPAQADARLQELRRNPEWASKALNIGTPERAEMQRLIAAKTGGR